MNDIHEQVPKDTHMYYFGPAPCSVNTALSIIKELKRSSPKPPDTDHTKSFNGRFIVCIHMCKIFNPNSRTTHAESLRNSTGIQQGLRVIWNSIAVP